MRILVGTTLSISSDAEDRFGKVKTSPMAESKLVPELCLDLLGPGDVSRYGDDGEEGEVSWELVTFLTLGFLFLLFLLGGGSAPAGAGGDSAGVGGVEGGHCSEERASVSLADNST